jgi:hypothetical protein
MGQTDYTTMYVIQLITYVTYNVGQCITITEIKQRLPRDDGMSKCIATVEKYMQLIQLYRHLYRLCIIYITGMSRFEITTTELV